MALFTRTTAGKAPGKPCRSLVPYLVGTLWLQMCLGVGLLASPYFASWRPQVLARVRRAESPAARIAAWRRTVCARSNDPRPGEQAPSLRLRTPTGRELGLGDLLGRKTILVFFRDDGG